jgi:hypothetical protein
MMMLSNSLFITSHSLNNLWIPIQGLMSLLKLTGQLVPTRGSGILLQVKRASEGEASLRLVRCADGVGSLNGEPS